MEPASFGLCTETVWAESGAIPARIDSASESLVAEIWVISANTPVLVCAIDVAPDVNTTNKKNISTRFITLYSLCGLPEVSGKLRTDGDSYFIPSYLAKRSNAAPSAIR
jgi:hypothetical protein